MIDFFEIFYVTFGVIACITQIWYMIMIFINKENKMKLALKDISSMLVCLLCTIIWMRDCLPNWIIFSYTCFMLLLYVIAKFHMYVSKKKVSSLYSFVIITSSIVLIVFFFVHFFCK